MFLFSCNFPCIGQSCVSSIYNVASNGTSDTSKSKAAGQLKKAYNSHEDKIKFTYMEQKEYETIDDDIEKLEKRVSELDDEIAKNATCLLYTSPCVSRGLHTALLQLLFTTAVKLVQ